MPRYIDADALIERIQYSFHNHERVRIDTVTETFLSEDCSPTIEARPLVRGEWIMKETMIRSPYAKNAYCSVCLEETGYAHKFCPNCGADNRGDDDGRT